MHSSERPGPGASAGGVRPAQMRSSAASFAEISPEVILRDGVGNSAFLFDTEHSFRYKTAWPWKVKVVYSYTLIGGVLNFQSVRGVESPWSMSTNSSVTAAVKG